MKTFSVRDLHKALWKLIKKRRKEKTISLCEMRRRLRS
jgi:hypothetical protein